MKIKGNFGELTLNINGTEASGNYQKNGVLKGQFINNIFKGQWENKGIEGLVEFTIIGNSLEGNWKKGLEPGPMKGKWEGQLIIDESMKSEKDYSLMQIPSEIKRITESLNNNFLFQVSLGSKELFHSNLIAWLLEQKNKKGEYEALKIFLEILHLKVPLNTLIEDEVRITREENNIDLIIEWKERGECKYVFIENKMKSIPTEEQLNSYDTKIEKYKKNKLDSHNKFLLTPFDTKIGENISWKNITYKKEILNYLDLIIDIDFSNQDIRLIIERYIEFTRNIVYLFKFYIGDSLSEFKIKKYNYYTSRLAYLRKIRLHDFILKNMHDSLRILLNEKLNDRNVEIRTNFTRGNGITDIFYDLKGTNFTIGLQIQGNTLKHCIFSKAKESNLKIIEYSKQIVNKKLWFYDFTKNPPELLSGKGKDANNLGLKIENTNEIFCEYSRGHFLYLSKSLNAFQSKSIDDLTDYILNEYSFLMKNKDEILKIIK
jgi:hypothetical protein